jgi:hypothetical protein
MRRFNLQTNNPFVRMEAGSQLTLSMRGAVEQILETPTLTDLFAAQPIGEYAAATEEQRERLRQAQREADLSEAALSTKLRRSLEQQSVGNADPIEAERLTAQIDNLSEGVDAVREDIVEESIAAGRLLTPEMANKKYGDLLNFDENISDQEARVLYDNKRKELIRDELLARSPKGIGPAAVKFGAYLVNSMTDPLELGAAFIPFAGMTGKALGAARFGRVGSAGVRGTVDGFLGSAMIEPLYYGLSQSQQLDYTMREALLNVGVGTILGGGLGTVAGAFQARVYDPVESFQKLRTQIANEIMGPELEISVKPREVEVTPAKAEAIQANLKKVNKTFGRKEVADLAVRQWVNDLGINVSVSRVNVPKRPMTFTEFVRNAGGVNDADPTFRGELNNIGIKPYTQRLSKKGNVVNGVSNPQSELNLDDIAELAEEAGYISERNPDLVVQALDQERSAEFDQSGNFVFSRRDQVDADDWREASEAGDDAVAEIARRQEIKQLMEDGGARNVSEEDVALVSEYMARYDLDYYDASERVGIELESRVSEMQAQYVGDIDNNSVFSDRKASDDFDQLRIDENDEIFLEDYELIVADLEERGLLSKTQQELLDEVRAIDAEAQARVEIIDAVTACVVRTT